MTEKGFQDRSSSKENLPGDMTSNNTDAGNSEQEFDNNSSKRTLPPFVQGVIWVVVLGFLVFLATGLLRAQKGIVAIGEPAPEFFLTTFSDDQYPQGRHILLIRMAFCKISR